MCEWQQQRQCLNAFDNRIKCGVRACTISDKKKRGGASGQPRRRPSDDDGDNGEDDDGDNGGAVESDGSGGEYVPLQGLPLQKVKIR